MSALLKEKSLEVELAVDAEMLSLAEGRSSAPTCIVLKDPDGTPMANMMQTMMKKLMGYTPKYDPELAQTLAMANWQGDPLSDRAILAIRRSGQNPHEVIEQFLNGGIDAVKDPSPELEQIWQETSNDPDWLDWDKLELGARTYRRFGVLGFQYQGISSIDGYRVRNIARTLMSTGQYSDDTAFKRFLLTSNFWTQISEPGGMRLHAEGWKTASRVRLLHTLIRRAVFGSDRWDAAELGMPINQVGLLAAPVISSTMMGKFPKILGFRTTDEETETMMHLWRYVAHVMGYVDMPAFPETVEEGLNIVYHLFSLSELTDDEDSIRLGRSFMDSFEPPKELKGREKLNRWIEHKVNVAQTAFFVLPETRKLLKLPNPTLWALLYWCTAAPRNFIQDTRRHRNPAYAEKLDKRVSAQRQAWLQRQLNEADLVYRAESKF